ncbi:Ninjurin C [Carabus blaptoides fortunei]
MSSVCCEFNMSVSPNMNGIRDIKTLDANRYATKKTIAQGMLDIALLTANASQLKYILQVGQKHEFYTLMLSLIIISIILQALQGVLCVFLGSSLNINKEHEQDKANTTNNICLALNIVIVTLNIIISAFDLKDNYGNIPSAD